MPQSLEYKRQWYRQNRQRWREYNRRSKQKRRASVLTYLREYRLKNVERLKKWRLEYYLRNRSAIAVRNRNVYARRKGADGSYTSNEWRRLKSLYGNACVSCHRQEPDIVLSADHIVPIAGGGTNTIDNIQPLCQRCNNRKYLTIAFPACSVKSRQTFLIPVDVVRRKSG